jgi:hypothetical protein
MDKQRRETPRIFILAEKKVKKSKLVYFSLCENGCSQKAINGWEILMKERGVGLHLMRVNHLQPLNTLKVLSITGN